MTGALDPDYLASLEPQPQYPADATLGELPERLTRKCCVYKSCGNTELVKAAATIVDDTAEDGFRVHYSYRRETNGDDYFGPVDTVAQLLVRVNDPRFWPVRK